MGPPHPTATPQTLAITSTNTAARAELNPTASSQELLAQHALDHEGNGKVDQRRRPTVRDSGGCATRPTTASAAARWRPVGTCGRRRNTTQATITAIERHAGHGHQRVAPAEAVYRPLKGERGGNVPRITRQQHQPEQSREVTGGKQRVHLLDDAQVHETRAEARSALDW